MVSFSPIPRLRLVHRPDSYGLYFFFSDCRRRVDTRPGGSGTRTNIWSATGQETRAKGERATKDEHGGFSAVDFSTRYSVKSRWICSVLLRSRARLKKIIRDPHLETMQGVVVHVYYIRKPMWIQKGGKNVGNQMRRGTRFCAASQVVSHPIGSFWRNLARDHVVSRVHACRVWEVIAWAVVAEKHDKYLEDSLG
jgi:hypothetical protein